MCGGTDSTAVIKGSKTLDEENKARSAAGKPAATPSNSAAGFVTNQIETQGFYTQTPPPDAPDLTDGLVRQRRAQQASLLTQGARGRRDSFLGGGDFSPTSRSSSLLGGY